MKTQFLFSIFILAFIASCKQKETNTAEFTKQKAQVKLPSETKSTIKDTVIPVQYFENDSLRSLLESELNKFTLKPKFDLTKEPKINKYDKTLIDTIKTLTFNQTKVYSYLHLEKEWICSAEIRNPEFIFLNSVKIGAKKQVLENILKSDLKSDLIKIGNLENTSVFIFTFENDILKTIDYKGYVD